MEVDINFPNKYNGILLVSILLRKIYDWNIKSKEISANLPIISK